MSARADSSPPLSDALLIERILVRDEAAFSMLYDRYSPLLFGVLSRILHDPQIAEEILQDTFLQLWKNAVQFDAARGTLAAWLVVIARNRALSRLRGSDMRHCGENLDWLLESPPISRWNFEDTALAHQLIGSVKKAMEQLPQEQRQAVELAYFEGLTQSEIAVRTGSPLGTVKTRLRSALETLKQGFRHG